MRGSLRGATVGAVTDRRRLIVMRHAKAEPFAPSDHARTLTDKGLASARDAGAHLRDTGVKPEYAVVSSAVRTRQTWDAVVEMAGITDCEVSFDDAVFTGGVKLDANACSRWETPPNCTTAHFAVAQANRFSPPRFAIWTTVCLVPAQVQPLPGQ